MVSGSGFGRLPDLDPFARARPEAPGFEAVAAGAKRITGPADLVLV
jgi:hypothetical protein